MREERGHVKGNVVIDEPYTLWGSIAGDVTPTSSHDLRFQADWLDTDFRRWLEEVPALAGELRLRPQDLVDLGVVRGIVPT